jgi:hypothetical protein
LALTEPDGDTTRKIVEVLERASREIDDILRRPRPRTGSATEAGGTAGAE